LSIVTTNQKGAIAETAIVHEAIKLGIDVYRPVMEGGRYDLLLDLDPRLVRVQCKWAARYGDAIVIRCGSCRRTRDGLLHRPYRPEEIDAWRTASTLTAAITFLSSAFLIAVRSSSGLDPRETTSAAGSTGLLTSSSRLHLPATGP